MLVGVSVDVGHHSTHGVGVHRDVGKPEAGAPPTNHIHSHHLLEVLQVELHGIVVMIPEDQALVPIESAQDVQSISLGVPLHGDIPQTGPVVLWFHELIVAVNQALMHLPDIREGPFSILQDVEVMKMMVTGEPKLGHY